MGGMLLAMVSNEFSHDVEGGGCAFFGTHSSSRRCCTFCRRALRGCLRTLRGVRWGSVRHTPDLCTHGYPTHFCLFTSPAGAQCTFRHWHKPKQRLGGIPAWLNLA